MRIQGLILLINKPVILIHLDGNYYIMEDKKNNEIC